MPANDIFAIQLYFDQRRDGRVHVHSPNVPGLHLAGHDLDTIRGDIEPVLRDLLLLNSKLVIEEIQWVPSLEEIVTRMEGRASAEPKPTTLVISGHAA